MERPIKHISEVSKILEAAIRHDPSQALGYAALLADKLERAGEVRASSLLRTVMAKAPLREASTMQLSQDQAAPRDNETRLATVDISRPTPKELDGLVLSNSLRDEIDSIVDAYKDRDRLIDFGIDLSPRVLLQGPPGTGKTSIARYIAANLDLPLVTTRSDALVSSLLGRTSKNIRDVFDYASRQPCVLFIDEIDALAKNRADSREVGELQRVVIALLENLDSFDDSSLVIGATNHPELLDPAIWRRFGTAIKTDLPNQVQREAIWGSLLTMLELQPREIAILAKHSDGLSGSAIKSAALDIARYVVLKNGGVFETPLALQRLSRYRPENIGGLSFADEAVEVRALRALAPEVFTLRALASLFKVSTRQIRNILGEINDRSESSTPASVLAE